MSDQIQNPLCLRWHIIDTYTAKSSSKSGVCLIAGSGLAVSHSCRHKLPDNNKIMLQKNIETKTWKITIVLTTEKKETERKQNKRKGGTCFLHTDT